MLIRDHFPAGASGQQLAPSTIMAVPAAPRRADPRANATASGTGASQVLPTQALTLTLSGAVYPGALLRQPDARPGSQAGKPDQIQGHGASQLAHPACERMSREVHILEGRYR